AACRLRPLIFWPPSSPCCHHPTLVVLTDWLSMTAAVGPGFLRAFLRVFSRSALWIRCQVPSLRQRKNGPPTDFQCGKSRRWQRQQSPKMFHCLSERHVGYCGRSVRGSGATPFVPVGRRESRTVFR